MASQTVTVAFAAGRSRANLARHFALTARRFAAARGGVTAFGFAFPLALAGLAFGLLLFLPLDFGLPVRGSIAA